MTSAHGKHVYIDYIGYYRNEIHNGEWMLAIMEKAVERAGVRQVHSHVVEFDGSLSPTGFAAVLLLDESHVSAHCYYDQGWLALDAFTCGGGDPNLIADFINETLQDEMPKITQMRRDCVERFLHEDIDTK
jgi:S-adenosylmethionine decarboxylase